MVQKCLKQCGIFKFITVINHVWYYKTIFYFAGEYIAGQADIIHKYITLIFQFGVVLF